MNKYFLRVGTAVSAGVLLTGSLVVAGPIHPAATGTTGIHHVKPMTNATARATLVAGGATLPALGYMGSFGTTGGATPVPNKFLAKPSDAKSVFGYFDTANSLTIQYCQTGSGYGKEVLDGAANAANPVTAIGQEAVNLTCTNGSAVAGTNGFEGPQSGTGFPLTDPDFAGSDAPMTATEYSTFITDKHTDHNTVQPDRGEPVQEPYIVGAVSLLYNNPDLANKPQVSLKAAQICEIYNGTITNWSQLGYKSRPLTFVYRSDGSGTTFSFANFLVKQTACKDPKSVPFSVSQYFPASTGNVNVEDNIPTNSAGASGNGNVTSCIVSNTACANGTGGAGSIGYVEAANAKGALNVASGIDYALVTNPTTSKALDPILNLPEAANAVANTIDVDETVVFVQGGLASPTPISPAPATTGCMNFADPGAYNNPNAGYPILAVSNLEFGQKANGTTNAANLQKLAKVQFTSGLVYANGYVIGGSTATSAPVNIDSVDAATAKTGTGKTGYSTLPSSYNPATNTTLNKAIGCIAQ